MAVLHHCHKRLTQALENEKGDQFCRNMKDFAWFILLGITLGISVSLKWTGVFLLIGVAVILMVDLITIWHREEHSIARDLVITGVCIGVIPMVIYVISFLPVYRTMGYGNVFEGAVRKSLDMFDFHKNAMRGHEYASLWYTWPFAQKPLVDLIVSYGDGKMSTVATFGNPLVWCGHLAALVVSAYQGFCRNHRTDRVLTILYLSLLIPWVFIGRTTYIYQYYGCMLAGTALLTRLLWRVAGTGKTGRRAVGIYLTMIILCFVLFYPVLTGNAVSGSYIRTWLEWGRNWKFTL
jgi:dolichyl-phosphate-mannose--protein O-mannosyl transferase